MNRIFEKIIVGCSGSAESRHVVEVAVSLGECLGARVVLLGVIAPASAESRAEGYALDNSAEAKQRLTAQLARIVDAARARGVDIVAELAEGDPEKQIEKHAGDEHADLIVVGHRDVSRLRHWLERSTSETLVKRAKTSVLVVHGAAETA